MNRIEQADKRMSDIERSLELIAHHLGQAKIDWTPELRKAFGQCWRGLEKMQCAIEHYR